MMYASLSAYMHDKKNSVTLYNRPSRSPSLMVASARKAPPSPIRERHSMSMINIGGGTESASANNNKQLGVANIHSAVLASVGGGSRMPPRMHSLEQEIRELDEKQSDSGVVSVLSVETSNDSMLVKLLNYLKDHKVGVVKIRKENIVDNEQQKLSERAASDGPASDSSTHEKGTNDANNERASSQTDAANGETSSQNGAEAPASPHAEGAVKEEQKEEIEFANHEKIPLRRQLSRYDVFVNLQEDGKRLNDLLMQIENQVGGVRYRRSKVIRQTPGWSAGPVYGHEVEVSPGFPMRIDELDITSKHVLMYGAELDADHPGFKDPEYRRRRLMFGEIALTYHHGQQLPKVDYNDSEKQTWRTVFRELMRLYPTYACTEFLTNMHLLQQDCLYSENDVPQLSDVSKFLKSRSGFQLRPVAGYLSPRDFLAGLAFRVFHTTQYIRHPSEPFYSPEPDCCHELLGHVPMLADPEFAQFSQEIGLASLGASEEDIKKLAILYFFTIEFGLCRDSPPPKPQQSLEMNNGNNDPSKPIDAEEKSSLRVYGAGLLSCVAELKHVLSSESTVRKFDPLEATQTECMITTFQDTYFYNNSFREAVEDVRRFAEAIKKPFTVRYNPYTESLEIIDNVHRVERLISELRQDATILTAALRRLGYEGSVRHITHNTFDDLP